MPSARPRSLSLVVAAGLATAVLAGCTTSPASHDASGSGATPSRSSAAGGSGKSSGPGQTALAAPGTSGSANVPDVYAFTRPGDLAPEARAARPLVYVPDTISNDVYVIDQKTLKVVGHYRLGSLNQHVVPSWDLKTLWVTASRANELIAFDPRTGKPTGRRVHVLRPYNMYFTTDGRFAVAVSENYRTLRWLRTSDMKEVHDEYVARCDGLDHMDFTADGRTAVSTCEFSGQHGRVAVLAVTDVATQKVVRYINLSRGAMPQDIKLSPDGRTFYVADMMKNGVHLVDARTFKVIGFVPTGREAHGLYVSRDQKYLYVSNRGEGSVSLISFATRKVVTKWKIPGQASPDMGNVSADGTQLWLSGRYDSEVYVIDTRDGHLIKRIPVGQGPHGLSVWPQPGRYSIGHTGIMR